MIKKLIILFFFSLSFSWSALANEAYFECIHSDKSESMFVYSYNDKKFKIYYADNYKLFVSMDIVNVKDNIIYAERYVPDLLSPDKMVRYSSIEFNILTYDMVSKTYGYDIEVKKNLIFNLKCNKFFKIDK